MLGQETDHLKFVADFLHIHSCWILVGSADMVLLN